MRIASAITMALAAVALNAGGASAAVQAATQPAGQQIEQREGSTVARGALDPVTPEEEAVALRVARADGRVRELMGAEGGRVVSVTPVLIKRGERPEKIDVYQREIEVVLFRPVGEVGARVVVNLRQSSVASVQRLAAAQVPFTHDDLNDAFQLAMRDAQVQKMLGAAAPTFRVESPRGMTTTAGAPAENVVTGLPLRSNDAKDPCSKHRCLQLLFRRGNDYLSVPMVTVDLSEKRVMVERRQAQ